MSQVTRKVLIGILVVILAVSCTAGDPDPLQHHPFISQNGRPDPGAWFGSTGRSLS